MSYLQADTTTLSVSQNSYFDGEFDQTWIIDKRGTSQYALLSAYESIGGIAYNNSLASISDFDGSVLFLTIAQHLDGSLSFRVVMDGVIYYLGIDESSSGSFVAWIPSSGSVQSNQKWYFEPCAYLHGDIDLNGAVESIDSRYILRAVSGSETPNTLQAYLCDIDCNGIISANDARLALRYASGLD